MSIDERKVTVWGGIGEKRSNKGTQWYIQDRIYDADGISPALLAYKSDYWIVIKEDEKKGRKNSMDCGKCFFSTMIDGNLWCCIVDEDLEFDDHTHKYNPSVDCEDYVAVEKLNEILKEYTLKIKGTVDEDLEEFIDERIDHFGA